MKQLKLKVIILLIITFYSSISVLTNENRMIEDNSIQENLDSSEIGNNNIISSETKTSLELYSNLKLNEFSTDIPTIEIVNLNPIMSLTDMNIYIDSVNKNYSLASFGEIAWNGFLVIDTTDFADLELNPLGDIIILQNSTHIFNTVAYGIKGPIPKPISNWSVARVNSIPDEFRNWNFDPTPTFGTTNDGDSNYITNNDIRFNELYSDSDDGFIEFIHHGTMENFYTFEGYVETEWNCSSGFINLNKTSNSAQDFYSLGLESLSSLAAGDYFMRETEARPPTNVSDYNIMTIWSQFNITGENLLDVRIYSNHTKQWTTIGTLNSTSIEYERSYFDLSKFSVDNLTNIMHYGFFIPDGSPLIGQNVEIFVDGWTKGKGQNLIGWQLIANDVLPLDNVSVIPEFRTAYYFENMSISATDLGLLNETNVIYLLNARGQLVDQIGWSVSAEVNQSYSRMANNFVIGGYDSTSSNIARTSPTPDIQNPYIIVDFFKSAEVWDNATAIIDFGYRVIGGIEGVTRMYNIFFNWTFLPQTHINFDEGELNHTHPGVEIFTNDSISSQDQHFDYLLSNETIVGELFWGIYVNRTEIARLQLLPLHNYHYEVSIYADESFVESDQRVATLYYHAPIIDVRGPFPLIPYEYDVVADTRNLYSAHEIHVDKTIPTIFGLVVTNTGNEAFANAYMAFTVPEDLQDGIFFIVSEEPVNEFNQSIPDLEGGETFNFNITMLVTKIYTGLEASLFVPIECDNILYVNRTLMITVFSFELHNPFHWQNQDTIYNWITYAFLPVALLIFSMVSYNLFKRVKGI